eukprot:c8054_g1_i1.p2 GENE.c8054_g1_i1~~c8054_g1_i1.p2  ORF type:complete len:140 (-),score=17.21 c8054_g1_i1:662-1081(-)
MLAGCRLIFVRETFMICSRDTEEFTKSLSEMGSALSSSKTQEMLMMLFELLTEKMSMATDWSLKKQRAPEVVPDQPSPNKNATIAVCMVTGGCDSHTLKLKFEGENFFEENEVGEITVRWENERLSSFFSVSEVHFISS